MTAYHKSAKTKLLQATYFHLPTPLFLTLAASFTFASFLLRLLVNQPEIYFPVKPVSWHSCSLSLAFRYGCSMLSRNHFWRILV